MGSSPSRPAHVASKLEPGTSVIAANDEEKRNENIHPLESAFAVLALSPGDPGDGSLSLENVAAWEKSIASNAKVQLARTVLSQTDIRSALASRSARIVDQHVFNNTLDFRSGPITNQKSSGRCWLFAATNVLRYEIMKKLKLNSFEFSQSYLFFWDKLNKANYYLELSIEHADLPYDDRLIAHISSELVGDGGQWDMVHNLLERYGFVPQKVYPESVNSSASSTLDNLLKTKLREHALILRRLSASLRGPNSPTQSEKAIMTCLRAKKEALLKEVYTILSCMLGTPIQPDEKFVWDYYNESGKFGTWEGTPVEFYKAFTNKTYPPPDMFSLINDPRNEFSKLYTVDKLGNVWGGRPVSYVNAGVEILKTTVVKMLKAGQPVFFGCDVGKFSKSSSGIMDTSIFDYENAFDITLGMTKAERLHTRESCMTHAMVISGVHLDSSGRPVRYKVENSWGSENGQNGYFVMMDSWFDEYVYQVVVHKALAPKDLVRVFEEGGGVVLPPWDPMGALA